MVCDRPFPIIDHHVFRQFFVTKPLNDLIVILYFTCAGRQEMASFLKCIKNGYNKFDSNRLFSDNMLEMSMLHA